MGRSQKYIHEGNVKVFKLTHKEAAGVGGVLSWRSPSLHMMRQQGWVVCYHERHQADT